MKELIETLDARSDQDLLILLGRDMAVEEAGKRLKAEDLRHFLSLGKRWFPELKLEIQNAVCSSDVVREAVTGDKLSNRIAIVTFIAAYLLEHFDVQEEGAIAFAILLLREGLQTFCESVWLPTTP